MRTWQDAIGEWASLTVHASTRDSALRGARSQARREGYRVADVAAVGRMAGSRTWRVEIRVESPAGTT